MRRRGLTGISLSFLLMGHGARWGCFVPSILASRSCPRYFLCGSGNLNLLLMMKGSRDGVCLQLSRWKSWSHPVN